MRSVRTKKEQLKIRSFAFFHSKKMGEMEPIERVAFKGTIASEGLTIRAELEEFTMTV